MQQVVNPPPPYSRGSVWSNTPVTGTPATRLLPAGPACQPCPDCGGLECLCRPRFFAGQLLTEQDLNRLEQYIIAKNRLHNRYLVGHGVVCGLVVTCSPCANTVSVSDGYAIDPCGSDIIVCSPDTVDICKLIKACTPTSQVDCGPYKDTSYCRDVEQEWILAIRYQETPSRGITPLTGAAQCSCGSGGGSCSCGGASSKTCGCGSMLPAGSCCGQTISPAVPVSTNRPRRGAPSVCEPTVTCEAYRYEVFPAPQQTTIPLFGGDFVARLTCCIDTVFAGLPTFPGTSTDPTVWSNYCCNLRQALIQYLIAQGGTDCQAIDKLRAVTCPGPNSQNFASELGDALTAEGLVVAELIGNCFCSVALPPCLPPGDPRVPLASVRIRSTDCTILSVCDWTPLRKSVVTTKTLGYWFGWMPFVPMLRTFMQQACCALFKLPPQVGPTGSRVLGDAREQVVRTAPTGAAAPGTTEYTNPPNPAQGAPDLSQPISFGTQTYRASNPISEAVVGNLAAGQQALSMGDLMHAMLDPISPGTAEALMATPRAKVLAEMVRPLVSTFGPLLGAATGGLGQSAAGTDANAATMAAMRAELDQLTATVTAQQTALNELRASPPATQQS